MRGSWLAIFVGAALAVALAPSSQGQPNRNGATWYQRAINYLDRLSPADLEVIDAYRAQPGVPPNARVREILTRAAPAMNLARRGARQKYADFELDYAKGFELELPHLHSMRRISNLMQADVYVRLHDGDAAGAAERIASMYRMGEHGGHDGVVISSLVGQAIWNTGDEALLAALDRGALTGPDAAIVLQAASEMPPQDPFSYVEATLMEKDLALSTLERFLLDEEGGGLEKLEVLMPAGQGVPPEIALMTPEELGGELDRYSNVMTEVTDIFAVGDREQGLERLNEIETELERGDHGFLCKLFLPALSRVFTRMLDGQDQLSERVKTLEALAAGELDALAQANAAVWYLAAIETMRSTKELDEATMARLRQSERQQETEIDEALALALAASGDVLDLLRQAAAMKRCDFSIARDARLGAPAVAPTYTTGLRDLLRLVLVDARLHLQRGHHDDLLDRLRIAWSMLAHFQADPVFATAIMTHGSFNHGVRLVQAGIASGLLSPDDRTELHGLAGRMRRTDPFGYVAAVVKAREDFTSYYYRTIPYTDEKPRLVEQLGVSIKRLDGDRLLFVGVIMETMKHAADERADAWIASLLPLDDVYDLARLEAARADVPRVAPLLAAHDVAALQELTPPEIGSIRRRMKQARVDLRKGLGELAPPSAAATTAPAAPAGVTGDAPSNP